MADTEFEEFRKFFDDLPQYIKAPAHCYTLVHDIDVDDVVDYSSSSSNSNVNSNVNKSEHPPSCHQHHNYQRDKDKSKDSDRDSGHGGSSNSYSSNSEESSSRDGGESILEPFSGDLQMALSDERDSPLVTRKRRKLPEIPKGSRRWNEGSRQVSLAQELSDADRYNYHHHQYNNSHTNLASTHSHPYSHSTSNSHHSHSNNSNHHNQNNQNNPYHHQNQSSSASSSLSLSSSHHNTNLPSNDSSSSSSSHRPIFVLKFSNGRDDESSPDSEKYPSLDSGHSTIHSDDGSKPYSPQIPSINESFSPSSPSLSGVPFTHLEILEATHRGLHKFNPRHHDEIEIDIGDPIYMQKEADDLWCEGVNLRTGMQGIFPSAYVVDVEYNDFDPSANKVKKERYLINYIGSIETLYHKGNEVLCQAVKKISGHEGYVASHTRPCILEISDQGIRMLDKGKTGPNQPPCLDYFYALKNISFCGFYPNDHRYFGFVTKHPAMSRFACHVFISDDSTRPVAESVGRAFQRFYQKFLETAYPIEDIYLE